MIYDGLESETVEQAMSSQFDRIEQMIFVRTRYEPGTDDTDDNGCD